MDADQEDREAPEWVEEDRTDPEDREWAAECMNPEWVEDADADSAGSLAGPLYPRLPEETDADAACFPA